MCNIGCQNENEEGICRRNPFRKSLCFSAMVDQYEDPESDELIDKMAEKGESNAA